jgi:hypothetical protein
MSDLDARIGRLETLEAIHRRMMRLGELCDAPYDEKPLSELWSQTGWLDTGTGDGGMFRGREEIRALLEDLAATFTLHYSVNGVIDLDPSLERATGHWYGWEAPVISETAYLGGFTSDHEYEKIDGEWYWASYRQTIHFLTQPESDWVKDPVPQEQRTSLGA